MQKTHNSLRSNFAIVSPRQRRGAMAVLLAIMMFAFLVTAAFSIDIAYMQLVKSELRSATDAAAKAAAEELARTQDPVKATEKGIAIGLKNSVASQGLQLRETDFIYGKSVKGPDDRFAFDPVGKPVNSVRVDGRRTEDSIGGPVPLFLGRMFNVRNFKPAEAATVTFLERDIVLVVDRSGSMNDNRKFRDLQDAITIFLSILADSPTEERVGLASYSTTATADVQMTSNLGLIRAEMARMPVDGFTNISGGMDAGGSIIQNARPTEFVERAMIVLTDGLQNRGRPAVQAAGDLADRGVIIHSITFGSDADQTAMRQVAEIGSGRFFHAEDGNALKAVFREIATTFTTVITQ